MKSFLLLFFFFIFKHLKCYKLLSLKVHIIVKNPIRILYRPVIHVTYYRN